MSNVRALIDNDRPSRSLSSLSMVQTTASRPQTPFAFVTLCLLFLIPTISLSCPPDQGDLVKNEMKATRCTWEEIVKPRFLQVADRNERAVINSVTLEVVPSKISGPA